MKIVLLVFANGREQLLARAIASAEQNLKCYFDLKVIINDAPESNPQFPGYITSTSEKHLGYSRQIQRAWDGLPSDIDYVFHLESDFIFNEWIPVADMIKILERHPKLAQVALVRQAVNAEERAAGGVLEAHPERFIDCHWNGLDWLENNFVWTLNPCVYPAHITKFPYPIFDQWPWGEGQFSAFLREREYRFAYLGGWNQKPKVTHIG